MRLIKLASMQSALRGFNYYEENKVIETSKTNEHEFKSTVKGTKKYNVYINLKHPRSSTCDCPFAVGRNVICKHMVATYFSLFPDDARLFIQDIERQNEEYEEYIDGLEDRIYAHINKMSKTELRNTLVNLLFECPEWLFDKFVRDEIN
ncbi:MAG: SWIM zinc finger family protein [Clostridia bacterium]